MNAKIMIKLDAITFNAVAFDMDGLIFDTEALAKQAFVRTAERQNLEVDEGFYQEFVGNAQPVCDQLMIDRYGAGFDTHGFREKWWQQVHDTITNEGVSFKPGFHELFETIQRRQLPMALVTTSSLEAVMRNFRDWDYPGRFSTLVTFDRGLPLKPAPHKYLAAAQDMNVNAANMLVLEDSNVGMTAAINARSQAVMVPDQVEPTEKVRAGATKIVNNLGEIITWIERGTH